MARLRSVSASTAASDQPRIRRLPILAARLLAPLGAPAALLISGLTLTGCIETICEDGIYPFDGQTGVALDSTFTLHTHTDLTTDMPALGRGITLERFTSDSSLEGEPVPFDVRGDFAADVITVMPQEPLAPEASYTITGVDIRQLRGPHFIHEQSSTAVSNHFYTRSMPRLLAGAWIDPHLVDIPVFTDTLTHKLIVLVFSEAMDIDTIGPALILEANGEQQPTSASIEAWPEHPHLVLVSTGSGITQVEIGLGALAASGVTLVEEGALMISEEDIEWLGPWMGQRSCYEVPW